MSKPATKRKLANNEAGAYLRSVRISPRKLALIADLIRGLNVSDALAQLTFSKKAVCRDIKKLLQSAIANAENNHNLDVDRLYVASAQVGKGIVMKRFHARARGRGVKILKPFSNMSVVLREREEQE